MGSPIRNSDPQVDAAVGGFVAGDAARRLVEVGEGDVNDVGVGGVHGNVRAVGGGDGGRGAPGAAAVGGADDVGGRRAGVEDDRVDAAVGAISARRGRSRRPARRRRRRRASSRWRRRRWCGRYRRLRSGRRWRCRWRSGGRGVDVDLEFVLPAAEHVAVAYAHVGPYRGFSRPSRRRPARGWPVAAGSHIRRSRCCRTCRG